MKMVVCTIMAAKDVPILISNRALLEDVGALSVV